MLSYSFLQNLSFTSFLSPIGLKHTGGYPKIGISPVSTHFSISMLDLARRFLSLTLSTLPLPVFGKLFLGLSKFKRSN